MNRDEYRRALIMLRGIRSGLSGYVRLERRTLMGTLQFTVNGVENNKEAELYALLLYRKDGKWHAVRLAALSVPRYGQAGLMWKFDPRNIDGRTLEQYSLAAVVERCAGICDLVLCGNLNGTVDVDWTQVRDAACRLFTPVRISGTPVAPIDSPEESEPSAATDGSLDNAGENSTLVLTGEAVHADEAVPLAEVPCTEPPPGEMQDSVLVSPEQTEVSEIQTEVLNNVAQAEAALDEFDTPAGSSMPQTAAMQLEFAQPDAPWPENIEPLRALFLSEPAIVPFEAEDYVFVRAPLPEETGIDHCAVGIRCRDGRPDSVMYAIPSVYTPEPPAGLEGYVWQEGPDRGYWTICERVAMDE